MNIVAVLSVCLRGYSSVNYSYFLHHVTVTRQILPFQLVFTDDTAG